MAIIILMLLMLSMSCCRSNKVKTEYKTIYVTPELYFPKYPKPGTNVLPYDQDFKQVTDADTPIEYVIMPFWYYRLILDFKLQVDETAAKYEAFNSKYHPP